LGDPVGCEKHSILIENKSVIIKAKFSLNN
jgi:hypothetical protein